MPALSSRPPSRPLSLLISVFAALSALLWLIPLFTSHRVLFPSGPTFEDILVYKGRFTLYHSAKFFTSRAFSAFAYPAGSAPIYEAFYKTANPVQTYCLLAAILTLVALAAVYACLHRSRVTNLYLPLLLATSFPLIFLIQRANIELILWALVACGILAYSRNLPILAAILFGLAATTKLYPIFMLGLFLGPASPRTAKPTRQHLIAFTIGVSTFLVGMIAALAYAGPTLSTAASGFFTGLSRFQQGYIDIVSRTEIAFDHCLFSPVKLWAYNHHTSPAPYTHLYLLLAATLALALFWRVRSLPFLNRTIFLTVAMVALPPVSFNYTLVHLYLPMLLLVYAVATQRSSLTTLAALALLLFVMLPLAALWTIAPLPTGLLQSLAVLALMFLSSLTAWPGTSQPGTLGRKF